MVAGAGMLLRNFFRCSQIAQTSLAFTARLTPRPIVADSFGSIKKDTSEEVSFLMVAGAGIEPATSGL